MKNEEAYNIISEFCFTGYEDNDKPSAKLFNAIRELVCEVHENAELKDYKARLEKENDKLKAEIERLKTELEQSVKMPCRVGDVVYDNDFGYPSQSTIVGYSFGYINQDDDLEIDLDQIYFYSKSNRYNIDMSFAASSIGESIFLTKEEAEQHLKGNTSNE